MKGQIGRLEVMGIAAVTMAVVFGAGVALDKPMGVVGFFMCATGAGQLLWGGIVRSLQGALGAEATN